MYIPPDLYERRTPNMSNEVQKPAKKELSPKAKTAIQYVIYGAIILAILAAVIGICDLYQYLCLNVWNI